MPIISCFQRIFQIKITWAKLQVWDRHHRPIRKSGALTPLGHDESSKQTNSERKNVTYKLNSILLQVFSAMEAKKHGTPKVFDIHK